MWPYHGYIGKINPSENKNPLYVIYPKSFDIQTWTTKSAPQTFSGTKEVHDDIQERVLEIFTKDDGFNDDHVLNMRGVNQDEPVSSLTGMGSNDEYEDGHKVCLLLINKGRDMCVGVMRD